MALVVGEVFAVLLRRRQVPALGSRGVAGLSQGLVGAGDGVERAGDLGLGGRRGERRHHLAEVAAWVIFTAAFSRRHLGWRASSRAARTRVNFFSAASAAALTSV